MTFSPGVSLPEALDTTDVTWTTGGDADWEGFASSTANDRIDQALSGEVGDSEESWLETEVVGPGTVYFHWRVSSQSGSVAGDFLRFEIDDELIREIDGEREWEAVARTVGSGTHTLKWRYVKSSSGFLGEDTAYLDRFRFEPGNPPLLEEGFDHSDVRLLSYGPAIWEFETETTHDGVDSLRAPGGLQPDQRSRIVADITGPGMVYFWTKTEAFNLQLLSEGAVLEHLEHQNDWTPSLTFLRHDPLRLEWDFRVPGNSTVPSGSATAFIDELSIIETQPLDDHLSPGSNLTWTTGGDQPWGAYTWAGQPWENEIDIPSDNSHLVRSNLIGRLQESWVETEVTGPGTVTFNWSLSGGPIEFLVDGVVVHRGNRSFPIWEKVSRTIGSGTHTLRWRYSHTNHIFSADDAGYLDDVRFVSESIPGLEDGMEVTTSRVVTWTDADKDSTWSRVTNESHDGTDSVRGVISTLSRPKGDLLLDTISGIGSEAATLRYRVKASSGQSLGTYFDGFFQGSFSDVDWTLNEILMDPGDHELRFQHTGATDGASETENVWVDEIEIIPKVSLDEALDSGPGGLTWTSGGDAEWNGFVWQQSVEGGDMAKSEYLSSNKESWVETTVEGPGTVNFTWRISAHSNSSLFLLVDGEESVSVRGEMSEWEEVSRTLAAGTHTLRWRFFRSSSSGGQNAAYLDTVRFVAETPPALEGALDYSDSRISTRTAVGKDSSWASQSAESHDGVHAARGAITSTPNPRASLLIEDVDGPATLRYWAKSSSSNQRLNVSVGSNGHGSVSNTDWIQKDVLLEAGTNVVEFEHSGGSSGASAVDNVWLDEVEVLPTLDLGEAVDAIQWNWRTGGDYSWTGYAWSESAQGGDMAKTVRYPSRYTDSWIETDVMGPGTVSFQWLTVTHSTHRLYFEVDGTSVDQISGSMSGWQAENHAIGAGRHTLRWRSARNSSSGGLNTAYLGCDRNYPGYGDPF